MESVLLTYKATKEKTTCATLDALDRSDAAIRAIMRVPVVNQVTEWFENEVLFEIISTYENLNDVGVNYHSETPSYRRFAHSFDYGKFVNTIAEAIVKDIKNIEPDYDTDPKATEEAKKFALRKLASKYSDIAVVNNILDCALNTYCGAPVIRSFDKDTF